MNITSIYYLLFIVVTAVVYYSINSKYRVLLLTLVSCGFIASLSINLLLYVLFFTLVNYFVAIRISNATSNKKNLFRRGILINILQLFLLRYADFTLLPVFEVFNLNFDVLIFERLIIPLGISYFTLQGIGYLYNIKMGWEKPETSYLNFLLYIAFFPKYLSGPIERSNQFLPQLKALPTFNSDRVTEGIHLVLIGFFKKVAIANQLAVYIFGSYREMGSLDGPQLWILFILQPIYLYFDFSGYTDIAIGIAKILGIDLRPNFNRPFLSQNMTNFWKRFHISLSSWFHDYIFTPMSFKYRKMGVWASIIGLSITWTLFGVWHGAGWTFMLLGVLQAVAVIYEYFTKKVRAQIFAKLPGFFSKLIGRLFTYLFYCISLVFFFAPDTGAVFGYFTRLGESSTAFSLNGVSTIPFMLIIYIPIFLVLEYFQEDFKGIYSRIEKFWLGEKAINRIFRWTVYSIMVTILIVAGFKDQQFVYVSF